eukprot:scaffold58913_cov56-Phaeocystis_antarctica.AAC.3
MESRIRFLAVERRWQRRGRERELRVRNLPNARGSAGRLEREAGVAAGGGGRGTKPRGAETSVPRSTRASLRRSGQWCG